jgi:hypothetical protein
MEAGASRKNLGGTLPLKEGVRWGMEAAAQVLLDLVKGTNFQHFFEVILIIALCCLN